MERNDLTENFIEKDDIFEFQITKREITNRISNSTADFDLKQLNQLMILLKVHSTDGIDDKVEEIKERKRVFGTNLPVNPNQKPLLSCFLEILFEKIFIFLLVTSSIRLIIELIEKNNKLFDFITVIITVFIIVLVMGITNYSKDKMFVNFHIDIDKKDVRVIRGGMEILIPKHEIVVGDLLIVTSGDILPVDGILVKSFTITLEFENKNNRYYNIDLNKNQFNWFPVVLSGSKVINGFGTILVMVVGHSTVKSKKNSLKFGTNELKFLNKNYEDKEFQSHETRESLFTNKKHEKLKNLDNNRNFGFKNYTPLQKKLEEIARKLGKIGIITSIIASMFLTFNFLAFSTNGVTFNKTIQFSLDTLIYSIAIVIVAVPVGLPLVVNLAYAFSIRQMKEHNTIVRNIESCENMAFVDYICTDYNEILTKGELKIKKLFIEEKEFDENKIPYIKSTLSEDVFNFLVESISINSTAYSAEKQERYYPDSKSHYKKMFFGDSIECTLLSILNHPAINIDFTNYRNNIDRQIIDCSNYSHENKICYTIINMEDKSDYVRLYIRGSSDVLLDHITHYIGDKATLNEISVHDTLNVLRRNQVNSLRKGCNPIILCYKDILKDQYNKTKSRLKNNENDMINFFLKNLVLICMMSIKDEIKDDVGKYLNDCKNAGIQVKIMTNQDKDYARISAEKCGILRSRSSRDIVMLKDESSHEYLKDRASFSSSKHLLHENNIIDAKEDLRKYVDECLLKSSETLKSIEFHINDQDKLTKNVENSLVIAQANQIDKFILCVVLKKAGYIVAVTGDGVSDYLAMNVAHVGISIGKNSSDMSKASSDIILLENDFKSIIAAIIFGRNIYDCVRKFLQFQITGNLSTVLCVLFTTFYYVDFYIYPSHLLWLNLILDTFGALSLASEPPNQEEMIKKKPYKIIDSIITQSMITFIIVQVILQFLIIFVLILFCPMIFGVNSDRYIGFVNWQQTNGYHTTIVFNVLIFMQIFNCLNSRVLENRSINIFKNLTLNKTLIIFQLLVVLSQLSLITFGGLIARTRTLSFRQNLSCIMIASLTLLTHPLIYLISSNKKNEIGENGEYQTGK